jgi:hypothetical protein
MAGKAEKGRESQTAKQRLAHSNFMQLDSA